MWDHCAAPELGVVLCSLLWLHLPTKNTSSGWGKKSKIDSKYFYFRCALTCPEKLTFFVAAETAGNTHWWTPLKKKLLISNSHDRESSLCRAFFFLWQRTDYNPAFAGQINPCWTEKIAVETDLEAKSTIWNYHPLWLCHCIINVKREKKLILGQNVFPIRWLMLWQGNTVGSLSSALYPANLRELFPASQGERRGKHIKHDYTYRARVCLLPTGTYLICLLPW